MRWAARNWHIVEAKAVVLGLIGRPGGPSRLLDLEGRTLIAFVEGIARELVDPKSIDALYDAARPKAPVGRASRADRIAEIQKAARLFGG